MAGEAKAGAWGVGLATFDAADGEMLEAWFPEPHLGDDGLPGDASVGTHEIDPEQAAGLGLRLPDSACGEDPLRAVRTATVLVVCGPLDEPPAGNGDCYLRLHLLSHRRVGPQQVNVDGLLGRLPNVAWTDAGPCPAGRFDEVVARFMAEGRRISVRSVDKLPRMTDYVVPSGVRIADADRVRLGAHLAEGTTVMHEGFVNFNAGTLGPSMVEGRISAGVVVGAGSDLGGGASIMGTLSGGGKEVISIGEGCLVGANAGVGISLGSGCVVEAGLYVTAGTVVSLPGGETVKAAGLSGRDGLLFRRNSVSGAVEAIPRDGDWGGLNPELHAN